MGLCLSHNTGDFLSLIDTNSGTQQNTGRGCGGAAAPLQRPLLLMTSPSTHGTQRSTKDSPKFSEPCLPSSLQALFVKRSY